jgi:TolA-binding protein
MTEKSTEMAKGLWGDDATEVAPEKPGTPATPTTPTPATPAATADAAKEIADTITAAKTLVRNREKDKAVESLKALVAKYPDHAKIKEAKDLLAVWDKSAATPATPTTPAKPANDAEAKAIQRKIELAQIFKKSNQEDKAISALQEIINGFPTHPDTQKACDLIKQWKK